MSLAPSTELCGEHITARGVTDLSTRNGQMRYLMRELGITRATAHRYLVAYQRDLERPVITAGATYDSDDLERVMSELPLGLKRARPVAKREWRVTSS